MEAEEIQRLSGVFDYFGNTQAAARSPLYERLALGASQDPDVLSLLEPAAPAQRRPTLLLAAVHRLLLAGHAGEPLARFYPSVTEGPLPAEDPWPVFREFCMEQAGRLRELVAGANTQINEVARCGALMPAVALAQRQLGGGPIALLDVGASAGLHLLLDRYLYRYGPYGQVGDPGSGVVIETDVEGDLPPFVPPRLPEIGWRAGLDSAPVDLNDPDQLLWLRAMVWPDADRAMRRLDQAIALARRQPVTVYRTDATELAEFVAEQVPGDLGLVIMHATLLTYLSPDQIADLGRQLNEIATKRGRLARVALEAGQSLQLPGGIPAVGPDDVAAHTRFTLALSSWSDDSGEDVRLAHAGTYGQTIAWHDTTTSMP